MRQFTKLNTDPDCTMTRGEFLRYRDAEYERARKADKAKAKRQKAGKK
jgi:hypothetical protein